MIPKDSPFSKAEIVSLDSPFTKRGSHVGFRLPTGQILVNFSEGTKHSILADVARQLGAELVSITGTWTFTPDSEQEYKVIRTRKS